MKMLKKKARRKFVQDNMRIRRKDRPAKAGPYGVEVHLMPIFEDDRDGLAELDAVMTYVRTLIKGHFKITTEKKKWRIHTRIRMENETDVMMLMLKNARMIRRVYRYE